MTDTENKVTVEIDESNDMELLYRGAGLVIKWIEWSTIALRHLDKTYCGTLTATPIFAYEYMDDAGVARVESKLLRPKEKAINTARIMADEIIEIWNDRVKTVAGFSFRSALRDQLLVLLPEHIEGLARRFRDA